MTVKGYNRAVSDPRNRAVAIVTDHLNIKYLGQMESLSGRPRRWNISSTVVMGSHGTHLSDDGLMEITGAATDHFSTDKMSIQDAIGNVIELLREDMGSSRGAAHSIYLVITINRN